MGLVCPLGFFYCFLESLHSPREVIMSVTFLDLLKWKWHCGVWYVLLCPQSGHVYPNQSTAPHTPIAPTSRDYKVCLRELGPVASEESCINWLFWRQTQDFAHLSKTGWHHLLCSMPTFDAPSVTVQSGSWCFPGRGAEFLHLSHFNISEIWILQYYNYQAFSFLSCWHIK